MVRLTKFLRVAAVAALFLFLVLIPAPVSVSTAQGAGPSPYYWVEATAHVTAYVLDENPTAMGTRVRDGIVASNSVVVGGEYVKLPLGCWISIPSLFGNGKAFRLEDRMRGDFQGYLDVWMASYEDARQFGVRPNTPIYILCKR